MLIDAELTHRINYQLMMLESARKEYAARLSHLHDYEDAFLRRAKHGKGNYFYYLKRRGSNKYCYVDRSSRHDVQRVREVRFLKEAIRRIERDICLLKEASEGFLPFDYSSVNESLPKIYRCEVPPISELYAHEGAKWKARQLEFQKRFPENYPQNKRHRTSDGVMVKTISELVVYERFKSAGLVQIYELPFPPDDYGPALYPDFTILSPIDMKTEIIVEFAGRLDRQSYREDFAKRVGRYIECGYVPGVNLFFVFGDKDGSIDSTQITKVIADIKGLNNAKMA